MTALISFSTDRQKKVAALIGYDFTKWNPDDQEQSGLFLQKALQALTSGRDCHGELLSFDDIELLGRVTGVG